jgi:hypothetical protein
MTSVTSSKVDKCDKHAKCTHHAGSSRALSRAYPRRVSESIAITVRPSNRSREERAARPRSPSRSRDWRFFYFFLLLSLLFGFFFFVFFFFFLVFYGHFLFFFFFFFFFFEQRAYIDVFFFE